MRKNSRKSVVRNTTVKPDSKSELLYALNRFKDLLQIGYTDSNYIDLSKCLNVIKRHVALADSKRLEEYWRDSYTDLYDEDRLNGLLDRIRNTY
jgi:hypothetical protein